MLDDSFILACIKVICVSQNNKKFSTGDKLYFEKSQFSDLRKFVFVKQPIKIQNLIKIREN